MRMPLIMQYPNMKSLKPQPTSYKDFLQQIDKAKHTPKPQPYKIKNTPRTPNPDHTQSTCLWDKRSPSHSKRLVTDLSCDKKTKSYNISQSQSHNHSQVQSHGVSVMGGGNGDGKSVKLSKKDKALSYHKFISEATIRLSELFKTPIPELLNCRVPYIEYLESLKSFKMIYQNYEPYPSDLVSQLWSESISGQNVGNLIITVCAILGLYESKQSQDDRYLKSKYESLRYTRMELNRGSLQGSCKENQFSFMPQISDRSRKLAASGSKGKLKIYQTGALTDRTNIIPTSTRCDRAKASIDAEQGLSLYNQLTQNSTKSKTDLTGNIRSQILYERAKQKSCERRENKSSNDIEYEKSRKQLTFKPTILKMKAKDKEKEKTNDKYAVRGEKNTISRMIRGRVEREVRKIINEKGVPYNEKIVDKMRKQKYEQITAVSTYVPTEQEQSTESDLMGSFKMFTPLFPKQAPPEPRQPQPSTPVQQDIQIDVYLSQDHKQKLVVRKGKTLEELAQAFIEKHGIGKQKIEQLVQQLQVSLNHVLCPIDELVDEEDQLASARTYGQKREFCW